jgi:mannose/fructose/N-acetylgalactosamine-specific phosphotransferase system component IIC
MRRPEFQAGILALPVSALKHINSLVQATITITFCITQRKALSENNLSKLKIQEPPATLETVE